MALSVQNGYVVYTRGSDSPYWDAIHSKAVAASGVPSLIFSGGGSLENFKIAGGSLKSLAQKEQQKELDLIKSATGMNLSSPEDVKQFIAQFNNILIGKKQFEAATKRLKKAVKTDFQDRRHRAPTIASWFGSYLTTALSQTLSMIKFDPTSSFSELEAQVNQKVDLAIDKAYKQMLIKSKETKGKEIYGDASVWKEVYDISQTIDGFNDYFKQMIRSKINFTPLVKTVTSMAQEGITKKDIRSLAESEKGLNLKNSKKSRALAGSVQEYIMSAMSMLGTAASTGSGYTGVFSSEVMKADNVSIYSFNGNLSADFSKDLYQSMNSLLTESDSLNTTAQIMEDFYNQYLSKLDKTFIVYGSTKSYAMTSSFSGFHAGGSRSLSDAIDIIDKAGLASKEKSSDFINAVYNTGSGALFENKREEISEQLKAALMASAAQLLFDDWVTIGESTPNGVQGIHVMQLEGINLPLSVFLNAAGEAMSSAAKDMESIIKISVSLPGEIEHKDKIEVHGVVEEERNAYILNKWNEQAAIARSQSNFEMRFLMNFKALLKSWI